MELLWEELGMIRCVGNLLREEVLLFILLPSSNKKFLLVFSLGRLFGSLRSFLELLFLFGLQLWGIFWFWFWIGVVCAKEMGNQLTTSLSIALLLLICGLWCLLCLALTGLCRKQWWSCCLVSKESLGGIGMLLFGWLCPIVWCGAFGRRGITGIFEDLERLVSDLKFFFLKDSFGLGCSVRLSFFFFGP